MAFLAAGDGATALRLGAGMTALQGSIGALNDIVDAPRDQGLKPGKPIPAGLVAKGLAWTVVAAGAALGLGLSAPSGVSTLALAVVVLAIGYGYDLVFKGTVWSWLPFAAGIPLLPVYGWLGATGGVPGLFGILLPAAVVAGAALAIANARADAERDTAAGIESAATRLGGERSWLVSAGLLAVVVVVALATLSGSSPSVAVLGGAIVAVIVIGLGIAIGRSGDSRQLERAWELEAVGMGLLVAAWLAGTVVGQ